MTTPEEERRARAYVRQPDSFLVVAEDDAVVAVGLGMDAREGDGSGSVVPGRCHIAMVFVEPDRWGQRIGARVLDALLDEARARCYVSIQLWTGTDNERAKRLYESRRFQHSRRDGVDRDTGERIVHYEREL